MGESRLVRIDLRTWKTASIPIGRGPRALEIDPRGRWIYATLNAAGHVARLDLRTGRMKTVSTGTLPRSLAIADDGKAIYVVNYESGTVSKLRTRDLEVLQTIPACNHPIGITYDAPTRRVWVACYGGSILVFDDRR
jgi:YVTN family beta-propeller protein